MNDTATESTSADRVRAALEGLDVTEVEVRDGLSCIEVSRDVLHDALARLRDAAGFEMVTFVTAVDRFPAEPRFEVNHQLYSVQNTDRVRVKTRVDSSDPKLPSCTDLWPGAGFMERECFDMFGVIFEGHPNLKRLLMPEEYDHHPLRKDFPVQGIEPDRLYREWDRKRHESWRPEE